MISHLFTGPAHTQVGYYTGWESWSHLRILPVTVTSLRSWMISPCLPRVQHKLRNLRSWTNLRILANECLLYPSKETYPHKNIHLSWASRVHLNLREHGKSDFPPLLGTALPGFRSCKPPWLRLSERPWDHKPLRRQSLSPWQGPHLCPLYFTLIGPELDQLANDG